MLHKGHRSRVRANIMRNGTDAFEVHELFEALLFYAIPYKDTNPTAHLLCNAFGTPMNVFRADTAKLCALSGVGAATADFLHLCADLFDAMTSERAVVPIYNTDEKAGALFVEAFRGVTEEKVMMLLLNNRGEKVFFGEVYNGSVNDSRLRSAVLIRYALLHHASFAYLGHNHTTNLLIPTASDLTTSGQMCHSMEAAGIPLINHFLIAGDRYVALRSYHARSNLYGNQMVACADMWSDADESLLPKVEEEEKGKAIEEGKRHLVSLLAYIDKENAEEKATRLLRYFPGIAGILRATCSDLVAVEGIGEREAVLLRVVGALLLLSKPTVPKKNETVTLEKAAEYVRNLSRDKLRENVFILLLDKKGCFIDAVKIAEGVANSAMFLGRQLLEAALYRHAEQVIIAHTHPDGNPYPSEADVKNTESILATFNQAAIVLLEHIVVTDHEFFPILRHLRERDLDIYYLYK